MDYFASIHKDPLFSIIIIVSIIVLVVISDYTRNRFKQKAKKASLQALAKNFEYNGVDENALNLIEISKYPIPTLTFIAKIYVSSGNYQEAIKIYLSILEKMPNLKDKIHIFELLGIAYYKAGFMQRAKNIFIEILRNHPRNVEILRLLMQTYEVLGEYKSALEVISCIEEIESVLVEVKDYIKILILINDSLMPIAERESAILKLNNKLTYKIVLKYFQTYNIARFWELIVQSDDISNYIDILWHISNPPLDLITQNKGICDVYRAKGIINDNVSCDIFALEALRILKMYSNKSGNLDFKYKCNVCQGIYPFDTHRCPTCSELGSIYLVLEIREQSNEKNYALL